MGVLLFDQSLKQLFLASGAFRENAGSLFGMETDPGLAAAALCIFLAFARKEIIEKKERIVFPLALILAGIASNSIDRIKLGFVIDYINLYDVCIFNLADLAIALGAAFFIWRIIRE